MLCKHLPVDDLIAATVKDTNALNICLIQLLKSDECSGSDVVCL